MRLITAIFSFFMLLPAASGGEAAETPETGLISTIAVAVEPGKTLDFAVNDLRDSLTKVTKREFSIVSAPDEVNGSVILRLADPAEGLAGDEWMRYPEGRNFVIEGGSEAGIVWGIYDFLEREAGCLWLDLDTTVIPENPEFTFPQEPFRLRPAVYAVEIYTGMDRNSDADAALKLRNRENTWIYGWFPGAGAEFGSPRANHTLEHYAEGWSDPSFFATDRNGNRQKDTYCLSNPKVRHAVAEKFREYIRADRAEGRYCKFYEISQNDTGYGVECVCPLCSEILKREGAYSGVLCEFLNAVSREVRDEFPEVTITTLAYNYTQEPPAHVVLEDNILVRMCGIVGWDPFTPGSYSDTRLAGWKEHAAQTGIWDYVKIYDSEQFPYLYKLDELPEAIRNCREYNVRHYFFEAENPLDRSFAQLQWWMMLHLATDPDRDCDELVNKFMVGYYGEAAAPVMRQYFDYLLARQQEAGSVKGDDPMHTKYCYLDEEFFAVVNSLLDQAEALAGDNELHARHVRREGIPVDLAFYTLMPAEPEYQEARSAAFARYAEALIETSEACPRLAEWRKIVTRNQMSLYAELEKLLPLPVPEQFLGREIIDVTWKDFTRYGNQMECISEDPDGMAGRTWGKPRGSGDKPFAYPLTFKLTDFTNVEYDKVTFTADDLPADGQYHWLRMGIINLPNENGLISSQNFFVMLWKGGVGIIPEPWEVWAHLKVTGPDFGGAAEDPNGIFCDRVIFVKP